MVLTIMSMGLVVPMSMKAVELDYPKTDKFQLFLDDDPYERYFDRLNVSNCVRLRNDGVCVPAMMIKPTTCST